MTHLVHVDAGKVVCLRRGADANAAFRSSCDAFCCRLRQPPRLGPLFTARRSVWVPTHLRDTSPPRKGQITLPGVQQQGLVGAKSLFKERRESKGCGEGAARGEWGDAPAGAACWEQVEYLGQHIASSAFLQTCPSKRANSGAANLHY